MDKELKRVVLQEKIIQIFSDSKMKIPKSDKPLLDWIVPSLLPNGKLNWSKWTSEVEKQEDGLKNLIENESSFFLWKKTQENNDTNQGTRMITKKDTMETYLFEIMNQKYKPILYDMEESEKKKQLVKSERDAREKIEKSIICYSIENRGHSKGLAIISSYQTMKSKFRKSDAFLTLETSLKEHKCEGFIFLDLMFAKNECDMKYGSRLLQRIENDFPNHILCLFSVPSRGPLYFYHSNGFSYSDMKLNSPNLLPIILDKIDKISEAWNEGFPLMTLLHAETDLRRPKIAIISNSFDWKIRDDVNIFFDKDALKFFKPHSPNMVKEATAYILKNRTCQRIVLLTPLFEIDKKEYFKICKNLLECANNVLKEDSSISDITVVCDGNEDRQIILRIAAANLWGECLQKDMLESSLQLPTPENVKKKMLYTEHS